MNAPAISTESWTLACSACETPAALATSTGPASVCASCGQPLFARYEGTSERVLAPRWDAWRYRALMPLLDGEAPVSLGEGMTPLIDAPDLAAAIGVRRLWIKDEGQNPTGSFKARGMTAAV